MNFLEKNDTKNQILSDSVVTLTITTTTSEQILRGKLTLTTHFIRLIQPKSHSRVNLPLQLRSVTPTRLSPSLSLLTSFKKHVMITSLVNYYFQIFQNISEILLYESAYMKGYKNS